MQLDPNQHLVQQLLPVSGKALEQLVAAAAASVGYTVFRGVFLELGGQRVAETDIFAAMFTPLRESRILLECKGGFPKFNDIRKFASLRALLDPPPDDLMIVCRANPPASLRDLAHYLNVTIVEKANLAYYVLPLLGGATLRQRRAAELNRYLAWQEIHEHLMTFVASHARTQQHYRFLASELWCVTDPADQVVRSFDAYTNQFPATCDVVAHSKGTTAGQYVYQANDDEIEVAMYVEVLHRLMNVYAVVRRTLQLMQHFTPAQLLATAGTHLRSAISALSSAPRYFVGFPSFLQTFLFVWGGFLIVPRRDWEIERMAAETGTTTEAIELYLRLLDTIFSGPAAKMFVTWKNHYFFKYVPSPFRALGAVHRKALDPNGYANVQFFGNAGPNYEAALGRALPVTGGIQGLRF